MLRIGWRGCDFAGGILCVSCHRVTLGLIFSILVPSPGDDLARITRSWH